MRSLLLSTLALVAGCNGASTPSPPLPSAATAHAAGTASALAAPAAPLGTPASQAVASPCAGIECQIFESAEAALAEVLKSAPRILAIGEAHAQKGSEGVRSTTVRFAEQLLPMLAPRASDLLIELWVADGSCGKREAKVEGKQQAVTQSQAATDQNEFVALGHRSKALGVTPHVLRPSCDEYDRILRAGPDAIDQMLAMIARLTAKKAKELSARSAPEKTIVAYGGAMHNDLAPRPGREGWSFGPELSAHVEGKYVELDLIVPEYVKDTEAWRAFPWYDDFVKNERPAKATLYRPNAGSFVLIFPRTPSP